MLSASCSEITLAPFANAFEGTPPASVSRFGGPRLFEASTSRITGDTYHLYLETFALRLGQSYALCVDYDGPGSAFELGDSGRRVYVTGAYGATEAVRKQSGQVVQLRCRPGECSGAMRVYLGTSCDVAVLDGTATALDAIQTDAVDLVVAGLEEEADDRGGLAASAPTMEAGHLTSDRVIISTCNHLDISNCMYF